MKMLPVTISRPRGERPFCDYTIDELASLTGVPQSRIAEWHRNGFLPAPSRISVGQRGRAPYRYPEEAIAVVRALGRWRAFVQGTDVQLWLWLEGADYIELSP